MAKEAVIIEAFRSPIGRAGDRGVYRAVAYADLVVPVLKALTRGLWTPGLIDDIITGSVGGGDVRNPAMFVGFPESVAAAGVGRADASSSQAIAAAARYIMNDDADIMIAAGIETAGRMGPVQPWEIGRELTATLGRRPTGAPTPEMAAMQYPEGWKTAKVLPAQPPELAPWLADARRTAEEMAQRFNISREESDRFALSSHEKALKAQDERLFSEIVPIPINYEDGSTEEVSVDQCPRRDLTREALAALPPYVANGRVTAGNSGPAADAIGLVLLASKEKAKELGLKPMCTVRHAVAVGVDPKVMGVGPYPAAEKILKRTGMKISDFDIIELNEAFACQAIYCGRMLGFTDKEWAKLNPKGGAIALGNPVGLAGVGQCATIAHEMVRRDLEWGLAATNAAGGQGMAIIFQREHYEPVYGRY